MSRRAVITGAFSFTGAAVAKELLQRGWSVHTLTNRVPPPGSRMTASPLRFDEAYLADQLASADAFVNTFWVRLPWGGQGFSTAVAHSRTLVRAAAAARVGRLVHVSVSNAAAGASLGYYGGKAQVEEVVRGSGLGYAIVKPTLIVGTSDVLTNNIAWFLRRFPIFPMPRGGDYRLQPITLDDVAGIVADAVETTGNVETDAAGPDVFTFADYVRLLARACGVAARLVSVPNWVALGALKALQPVLRDVVLTREELLGLEQELLVSHAPPTGRSSVAAWLMAHGKDLGRRYVNDMERHFGRLRDRPVLEPDGDAVRPG